jgi:hypothetical protein
MRIGNEMGALLVIIGWFMAVGGLAVALVFPQLEGEHTFLGNLVPWAIPIVGIYLILFANRIGRR